MKKYIKYKGSIYRIVADSSSIVADSSNNDYEHRQIENLKKVADNALRDIKEIKARLNDKTNRAEQIIKHCLKVEFKDKATIQTFNYIVGRIVELDKAIKKFDP